MEYYQYVDLHQENTICNKKIIPNFILINLQPSPPPPNILLSGFILQISNPFYPPYVASYILNISTPNHNKFVMSTHYQPIIQCHQSFPSYNPTQNQIQTHPSQIPNYNYTIQTTLPYRLISVNSKWRLKIK